MLHSQLEDSFRMSIILHMFNHRYYICVYECLRKSHMKSKITKTMCKIDMTQQFSLCVFTRQLITNSNGYDCILAMTKFNIFYLFIYIYIYIYKFASCVFTRQLITNSNVYDCILAMINSRKKIRSNYFERV